MVAILTACDPANTRRRAGCCFAPRVQQLLADGSAPTRGAADARRKCQGPGRPRSRVQQVVAQVELEEVLAGVAALTGYCSAVVS